jgi:hypothetical protein
MPKKKILISENQGRLPFASAIRKAGAFALERRLILIVGLCVGAVAIAYAYFIVASVSHTAVREELARENAAMAGNVASLESQYLARGGAITEAFARHLGFVTPSSQVFLTRTGTLSFRDAR